MEVNKSRKRLKIVFYVLLFIYEAFFIVMFALGEANVKDLLSASIICTLVILSLKLSR